MFEKLSERVQKFTFVDVNLVEAAILFATIAIIKLFPRLLKIDNWILVVLMIACSAKPFYKFWIKK